MRITNIWHRHTKWADADGEIAQIVLFSTRLPQTLHLWKTQYQQRTVKQSARKWFMPIVLNADFSENIKAVGKNILRNWKVGRLNLKYYCEYWIFYLYSDLIIILLWLKLFFKKCLRLPLGQKKWSDMGIPSTENNKSRGINFKNTIHEFASIRTKGIYFTFA